MAEPQAFPEKAFPVSWDQFHRDARALAWRLAEAGPFQAVVCITRGGLVPAAIVARELGIRVIETVCIASYNHTTQGRSPLNVALSRHGKTWKPALVLENAAGEYSYPAVIQSADGLIHVTYTWKRQRIKHVVIDPSKLQPKEFPDAGGK